MPSKKLLQAEQGSFVWDEPVGLIAGVDEAGRGPLVGPVVAAAVILNHAQPIAGLADSKKLTEVKREQLFDVICAQALCYCIASATAQEIEEHNILQATMLAMQRAVDGLEITPCKVLVDGNRLPVLKLPAEAVVKGDAKVQAISAASILAKVTRDRWCAQYNQTYPQYGFAKHKGYGTAAHLAALQQFGVTPEHRKGFAPIRALLSHAGNTP